MCRGTLGVWGCECVCYGYLFGLFLLAPLLSQGCCRGCVWVGWGVVVLCGLCCWFWLVQFFAGRVCDVCVGCLVFLGATERSEGGSCGVVECWWVFSWFRSSPPSGCRCQTSGRCCSAHTCSMFVEAFVVPRLIDRNGSLWALAFRHGTDPRFRSRCASVAD